MKTLIAMPVMRTVTAETFIAFMGLKRGKDTGVAVHADSLVYMARNNLTLAAIDQDFDYILWIDSDMTFESNALEMLLEDAKNGCEFVTALCFSRKTPVTPVICKRLDWDMKKLGDEMVEYYLDYPQDQLFEIAGSGMAFCLTSVDLLKRVAEAFGMSPYTPLPQLGEDYSFCWRVAKLGVKMYCDSRVKCGHVGTMVFGEDMYER